MREPRRLVIVLNHPVQNFSPGFRYLSKSREIDLTVLYWVTNEAGFKDPDFDIHVRWDVDLLDGYRWRKVAGEGIPTKTRSLWDELNASDPEVVLVAGWGTTISRLAIAWAKRHRRILLVFGDSTSHKQGRPLRGWWKRLLLRTLLRTFDGAFSTGTFNRTFYEEYGMDPRRIFPGVLPVDTDLYSAGRPISRRDGTIQIGFAGKLVPWKGADELLRAVALLPDEPRWDLWVIGEGPERSTLEPLARSLGIDARTHFVGFRNQSEMPQTLASLDVLVLPSVQENRGLVVSEAMAAGTPAIVSSATGVWGPGDLVEHGVTGWVYPTGDIRALADLLVMVTEDRDLLVRVAEEAVRRVEGFGPAAFATKLEDAVAALTA